MPSYTYRVRKPPPPVAIDRTLSKPSAEKAAKVSRPSTAKAGKATTTRKPKASGG
jgi:hypothetical protein